MAGPVQSVSFNASTGTSVTVTISATGTGNCLVVYFAAKQITTTPHVSGITLGGAAGNFALAAQELPGTSNCEAEIWTDRNATSGQTSVVISWTGGSGAILGVAGRVEEWAGIITGSSPVDKTNTGTAASSSWSSGSTGTLTQASEVVVGMVAEPGGSGNTITGPSSPWTNQAQVNSSTNVGMMSGWQQVSATTAQTYSGTLVTSNTYAAVIVSLLASTPHTDTASLTVTPTFSVTTLHAHVATASLTVAPVMSAVPQLTVPPPNVQGNTGGSDTAALWEQLHTGLWKPVPGFGVVGAVPVSGSVMPALEGRGLPLPPPPPGYSAAGPPPPLTAPGPGAGEIIMDELTEVGRGAYELGRALSHPMPPSKLGVCKSLKRLGPVLLYCTRTEHKSGKHTDGRVYWD